MGAFYHKPNEGDFQKRKGVKMGLGELLIVTIVSMLPITVLVALTGLGVEYDKRGKGIKTTFDEKTGKIETYYSNPYHMTAGLLVFGSVLALCMWWVLSGNFQNSVRMPWG